MAGARELSALAPRVDVLMNKHPVPWTHNRDTGLVADANGATVVCELYPGTQGPEDADGVPTEDTSDDVVRLMLAAPQLLVALQNLNTAIKRFTADGWVGVECSTEYAAARALIARLEGK